MANPRVLILMGSDSDYDVMKAAGSVLRDFGIEFEITVASAHRSPERAHKFAIEAAGRGVKVIIAGAGYAAHLAGVLAATTTLPILGVPIGSSDLDGLDALLATVQMPGGIPVATFGIGKSGAKNAGMMAAQILALSDEALAQKLTEKRAAMADGVEQAAARVAEKASRDFDSI